MTTQLAPTPVLRGEDAKKLLDSLKKPTEKSKKNGQLLVEYFKNFEQ